ncbi:hypothetical protein SAMN04515671_2743 [Nakamurella panacisegetis]|uniref:DUF1453 domain-containing protein n=1 Tax=Nakamurella panacisegetis TaxID=1090615 RepID=A0A1H0PED3_9ACTN|nr:hypothetical protein [Nakamurella panacisegetis]SDP03452.1 hypothetical protein SAMN04515671_2743 [Nakamurella panacisegetis]
MTTSDWIIDIVLILIVVRQMREEKFTARVVLLPAGIVAFVAHSYLHSFPTGGNDLLLIGLAAALGIALGLAGGLLTRVRSADGAAFIKAGPAAAGLWIASMTARLGFIIWISHHSGAVSIADFSVAHHITSGETWQTALVLLALTEVVARIAVIAVRSVRAARLTAPATAVETAPVG